MDGRRRKLVVVDFEQLRRSGTTVPGDDLVAMPKTPYNPILMINQ
jgi:hypothetical protein